MLLLLSSYHLDKLDLRIFISSTKFNGRGVNIPRHFCLLGMKRAADNICKFSIDPSQSLQTINIVSEFPQHDDFLSCEVCFKISQLWIITGLQPDLHTTGWFQFLVIIFFSLHVRICSQPSFSEFE